MIYLFTLIIIVLFLIIFKNNKYIKPIAIIANELSKILTSFLAGSITGCILGYLIYGQILGIRIPVSSFFDKNDNTIENVLIGSIEQNIITCTILGGIVSFFIYLIVSYYLSYSKKKSIKNNNQIIENESKADQISKLFQLKEMGAITKEEYDLQKKELLNISEKI